MAISLPGSWPGGGWGGGWGAWSGRLGGRHLKITSPLARSLCNQTRAWLPRRGGELPADLAAPLRERLTALEAELAPHTAHPYYPDVACYTKAVQLALKFGEFYAKDDDGRQAVAALDAAEARLAELSSGSEPSWCRESGLVIRGYLSPLDGSVQPYGLEVPPEAVADDAPALPLFVWLHGRGDTNTDLGFISGCASSSQFPSANPSPTH